MSIIEKILSKWNFKKIAVGYIVAALILIIGCVAAVGIIFGDRISFICQYHKLSESVQKNDFSNIKNQMDSISSSSNTIIDVLMLDKNNNVVYSSNNSVFGKENFTLYKADNKMSYFTCGKSSDTVLKYLENKSFMAASIFDKE